MGWPLEAFNTQTELPVLSATCSSPSPNTSASAGLPAVLPSRVCAHRRLQPESMAISWSVLEAPG
ncbi:MAG TPA: hypothetical protein VMV06_07295 [Acidimicrobiales bacterium]|nr:hypothetical protein [Acidimicrobiales bacterium]